MDNLKLNKESEKIINNTLKLKSLDDIIDFDYTDKSPENENEKRIAENFQSFNRGSARFAMRSFYTQEELRSAEKESNRFVLP